MLSVQSKQKIKRLIAGTSTLLGCNYTRSLSVILNYHSIHPTHGTSTRPEDFSRQIEYIKKHFTVISLRDFHALRTAGKSLPERVAMITFDDGYQDNYDYAYHILKGQELPATVFVTTGYVSGEAVITDTGHPYRGLAYLRWPQIREMRDNGIYFGAHTHSHPILTEIAAEAIEREILQSKKMLEDELGEQVRHFAYPL